MRSVFQLKIEGLDQLPRGGPIILAPNHSSSLDPLALAAALPFELLCRTHWAGRTGAVLRNPIRRVLNRLGQTVPVERDRSALAIGAAVLRRGRNLIWFPEGRRSTTGRLQKFQWGIGALALHFDVPVVPVLITGVYQALPPGRHIPRMRPIGVVFGAPLTARSCESLSPGEPTKEQNERFAACLHDRVAQMQRQHRADVAACRAADDDL